MIRAAQEADAPALAALQNAHYLHHFDQTPQALLEVDREAQARHGARWGRRVLEEAGQIRACLLFWPLEPGVFRFQLIGESSGYDALYADLRAGLEPHRFRQLQSVTREDMQDMDFLAGAGFANRHQSWGAHLALEGFDFAPYAPLEERLFLEGYEFGSVRAGEAEALWKDLYVLFLETWRDAPHNPTTTPDFANPADFCSIVRGGRAFFVTFRGGVVGYTLLSVNGALESEHTAVHSGHRRKGLATVLKAQALAWAWLEGHREAGTGGTVLNLPMLRVNQKLGYGFEPMWCTWVLEVG